MSFIGVFDRALSPSLCTELISQFDAQPEIQRTGRIGSGIDEAKKRSRDITLDRHQEWSRLKERVAERVFACLGEYARRHYFLLVGALSPSVLHPKDKTPVTLDDSNFAEIGPPFIPGLLARCFRLGVMNLQRYEAPTGGYPHWHSEVYPEPGGTEALHRVLFWICYLNDVEVGGETEFAYQNLKVQPKTGRLLIAPAGFTHTHRGNPPMSNPKYVIASWLLCQTGACFQNTVT